MLSKVYCGTSLGLSGYLVVVEVDVASLGLPSFTIVGLADTAIQESKERVRSAIKNSSCEFPPKRITINLAPADLQKNGPLFDLPIAVGILLASGQILGEVKDIFFAGELSLGGQLSYTNGILPLTILAKNKGFKKIIIPKENIDEATIIDGIEIYGMSDLSEVVLFLNKEKEFEKSKKRDINLKNGQDFEYNFSQIKGQEQAKRALEIAAAGGHNVLLKGPPGAGKTLLARSFPSILPSMSLDEALEVTQIYSITGNLTKDEAVITKRPFRAPHHTASHIGIIGGGNNIKPGEVSLAHRGVLFLDELPEFPRAVLEALRQPLEDRQVVISRASGSLKFPAKFILLAAHNPCPCGYLGSNKKSCVCLPGSIAKYSKKLSGPLLDRIDIHLDVPAVEVDKLTGNISAESSEVVRERVEKARELQLERFKGSSVLTNAEMSNNQIKEYCKVTKDALELLKRAIVTMNLSARSYHRVLKLSRTIADLDNSEIIDIPHVAESLQYRAREEN